MMSLRSEGRVLPELDPEAAAWLVSEEGLACVAWVTESLDVGDAELVIGERLRRRGLRADQSAAAVAAAMARRLARRRWPDADRLLFTRSALEQASDPEVSRWRARRFADATAVMDVGAGVGGDALALGATGTSLTAVEKDPARIQLLEHNLRSAGIDVRPILGDGLTVARPDDAWLHADPSRRDDRRRLRALRDHLPSVPELLAAHADAPGTAIVLSPAVDLDDPDLPGGEIEFLQLGGELIESTMWLGAARQANVDASATLLPSGDHRQRCGSPPDLATAEVGDYLIEVAPAAIRARLHTQIGIEIEARRIARRRALLTADSRPPASPWYRSRRVETVLASRPKDIRRWLRTASELPLEIAVHGLRLDPVELWRQLGRPPRGPQGRRLDMIRLDTGAIAVVSNSAAEGPRDA